MKWPVLKRSVTHLLNIAGMKSYPLLYIFTTSGMIDVFGFVLLDSFILINITAKKNTIWKRNVHDFAPGASAWASA